MFGFNIHAPVSETFVVGVCISDFVKTLFQLHAEYISQTGNS